VEIELGGRRSRRGSSFLGAFVASSILILILAAGGLAWIGFRTGDPPVIGMKADLPAIGKKTTIQIELQEPKRGLSRVMVELVQGDKVTKLREETFVPQPAHMFWAPKQDRTRFEVVVGRESILGLLARDATIRVTADRAGTWLENPPPAVGTLTLPVRITPPALQAVSSQTYVAQGGCEVVIYEVGPSALRHGVRAKARFFRGYDLPGGKGEKFALFAVPYDVDDPGEVKLYAVDDVGNDVAVDFIDHFSPKPYKTDTIEVTDAFMQKVVPQIIAQTPDFADKGSLVANYVAINGEMRKKNDVRLAELAEASETEFLWKDVFLQMSAQVVSSFADRRTYIYGGKEIDRQDHLGFDLASTSKAPIPASNGGLVVLADFFGIYGNAVVIDHGFGLMSLYGHMSKVEVKTGDRVERGQIIGKTGATGLALGDHLHFTMLLQGLPVTPIEWWDRQWIENRIASKLGPALGFAQGAN
jgi:hypothetical protein